MIEGSSGGPTPSVRSVAELVRDVGDLLATRFSVCAVRGEISGFARAASGHSYFTLKDADGGSALLRCAMFRRAAALLDFAPNDGQLVQLRGRVSVFEPRGELQFVVEAMQLAGAGALYEKFLQARARLQSQGLFDASRKRSLPAFPRVVGVITSLGAAALHDVLSALARRAPHVQVIVYPSLVQGAEAPVALVAAIGTASRRAEVDVLIVCRGGGSLEDLWAFNDERVVRAIVDCRVPLISGVGHEADVSLADLAADLRAPTPTAAAELAAPQRDELLSAVRARAGLLSQRVQRALQGAAQRLDRAGLRLSRPSERLGVESARLSLHDRRLQHGLESALTRRGEWLRSVARDLRHGSELLQLRFDAQLHALATRLHALDPQQVVARGYALIEAPGGSLIVDPAQLHRGMALRLTLARGVAQVELDRVERV